jgi:hypothetical protein
VRPGRIPFGQAVAEKAMDGLFKHPLREPLNNSSLNYSGTKKKNAIFLFLTFSMAYSHGKWRHIPVPRKV